MNVSILQKCVDELNKESPKLDYVRGMLEALMQISELNQIPEFRTHPSLHETAMEVASSLKTPVKVNGEMNAEAQILDANARAAIEAIKANGGDIQLP